VSLGVIARELGVSKTTVARNLTDAADGESAAGWLCQVDLAPL